MKAIRRMSTTDSPRRCAAAILDTALLVVRLVRSEFRGNRTAGLSVTQIRSLAYLEMNPGASLSDLAEHLGLGAPTVCKLVSTLVRRRLVRQGISADDRRRLALRITPRGARVVHTGLRLCRALLAERVAAAPPTERAAITHGMRLLRPWVAPHGS